MSKKGEELKKEQLIIGCTMSSFLGSLDRIIFFHSQTEIYFI